MGCCVSGSSREVLPEWDKKNVEEVRGQQEQTHPPQPFLPQQLDQEQLISNKQPQQHSKPQEAAVFASAGPDTEGKTQAKAESKLKSRTRTHVHTCSSLSKSVAIVEK